MLLPEVTFFIFSRELQPKLLTKKRRLAPLQVMPAGATIIKRLVTCISEFLCDCMYVVVEIRRSLFH